jgi:lactoylglutathione lyase
MKRSASSGSWSGFTPMTGWRATSWNYILTFNPGWDSNAQKLATFTDIRQLQRELRGQGVEFQQQADETTTGPASFIAVDPDGNPILVDQHV